MADKQSKSSKRVLSVMSNLYRIFDGEDHAAYIMCEVSEHQCSKCKAAMLWGLAIMLKVDGTVYAIGKCSCDGIMWKAKRDRVSGKYTDAMATPDYTTHAIGSKAVAENSQGLLSRVQNIVDSQLGGEVYQ